MDIKNVTSQTTQSPNVQSATENVPTNQVEKSNSEGVVKVENYAKTEPERNFAAINKDGDTLEISDAASKGDTSNKNVTGKLSSVNTGVRMSEAALSKCSKSKLRQLLQNGQISKQQYEKAMKKQ